MAFPQPNGDPPFLVPHPRVLPLFVPLGVACTPLLHGHLPRLGYFPVVLEWWPEWPMVMTARQSLLVVQQQRWSSQVLCRQRVWRVLLMPTQSLRCSGFVTPQVLALSLAMFLGGRAQRPG